MPYPNPEGILYYYFVPTSYVASVETSINTTRNRYEMCTHPTGGNLQYIPKPRIWYLTINLEEPIRGGVHRLVFKRVMLVVLLLNSSISILVLRCLDLVFK